MSELFVPSFFQPIDANGAPQAGAKLYFYESGTTNLSTVYKDSALTVPHTNPVIADAAGIFPPIYRGSQEHKTILQTASFLTIQTVDPVPNLSSIIDNAILGLGIGGVFRVPTTDSIASTVIPASTQMIVTSGCSVVGDGGEVDLVPIVGTPSPIRPYHKQSQNGRWFVFRESIFWAKMFGAKGDSNGAFGNGTNDTQALTNFHDACQELNVPGLINAGIYRGGANMTWDQGKFFQASPAYGTTITGVGEGDVVFVFDQNLPSPNFKISNVTGFLSGGQRAVFYGRFGGIRIEGYAPNSVLFQIGEGDTLGNGNTTCYQNGFVLEPLVVANRAPSVNAVATLLSGLVTSTVNNLTTNCGGVPASHGGNAADFYGTALQLQHCSMSNWFNLAAGNAKNGVYFKSPGSMHGNTFMGTDFEVLETAIKSDNGNTRASFTGGTITLVDYMFDCTAGQSIIVDNILLGDVRKSIFKNPNGGAGLYGGWGVDIRNANINLVGVQRLGSYFNADPGVGPGPTVPTQPIATSNTWFKNGGQKALVYMYGASNNLFEVYKRDWFDFSSGGRRVGVGPIATSVIPLNAGESVRIQGLATGQWNWFLEPLY